jgi:hypothetical protein
MPIWEKTSNLWGFSLIQKFQFFSLFVQIKKQAVISSWSMQPPPVGEEELTDDQSSVKL